MNSQKLSQAALLLKRLSVLVILLTGCSAPPPSRVQPQAQANPIAPVANTPVGPVATSNTAGVLYQDNFVDANTGWPKLAFDNYFIGYHEPNHYHVEVHAPNDKAIVTVPKLKFDDFTLAVKVLVEPNNTAQTGDFRYGMVFRRSGSNYYAFAVSPRNKTWYLLKSSPTALTELKTGQSNLIQGLKTDDILRVDARGASLSLWINDQAIGDAEDASYTTGEAGLFVETFDSPRAHIHFGNITITKPGISAFAAAILYQDNFTDLNTGWPKLAFDNYFIGYHEPNHYHVEVHAPNDKAIVTVPKQRFDDFTANIKILVEPNNTAKTGDFRYGVIFRRSGNNYYAFAISPRSKTWYLLKSSPNALTELKHGSNDTIQGLKTDDILQVQVQGPNISLSINDQSVGQISDSSYITGEVGFIVETYDSARAHIHFGNITVSP